MIVRPHAQRSDGYDVARLFNRLVKFTALVHLEIEIDFDNCYGLNPDLVHPNLRVLCFGSLDENAELYLEIDCPRLEVLQCDAPFNQCIITYPETIKQLFYYRFNDIDWWNGASPSDLEAFANVELYVCEDTYSLNQMNIWIMPKLKELRVIVDESYNEDFELFRNILADLFAQKERLGAARGSPKVYLNDKECSTNLKESHPWLFLSKIWTDDEIIPDSPDEDAVDDEGAAEVEDSMEAHSSAVADLSMEI